MHLLNWNINLWLSRFRAIKSNGTGTTIKFVSFSMVGRQSRDGWGTWVRGETEGFFSVTTDMFTDKLGFAVDGGCGGRGTEVFIFVTSGAVANGLGFVDGGGGSGGIGSWGAFINGEKNLGGCVNERTHLRVC